MGDLCASHPIVSHPFESRIILWTLLGQTTPEIKINAFDWLSRKFKAKYRKVYAISVNRERTDQKSMTK